MAQNFLNFFPVNIHYVIKTHPRIQPPYWFFKTYLNSSVSRGNAEMQMASNLAYTTYDAVNIIYHTFNFQCQIKKRIC